MKKTTKMTTLKTNNISGWQKVTIAFFVLTAIFVVVVFFVAQVLVKEAHKEVMPKTQVNSIKD